MISVDWTPSSLSFGKTETTSNIYLDIAKTVNVSLDSFLASTAKLTSSAAAQLVGSGGPAMIYYSADPQFGALLFSLSARNERSSLFGDPFATCIYPPSGNVDLVAYAHSTIVQLLELGQQYACFLSQVRAGGVVLLVGVGSLVCWRLWAHWRYGGEEGDSDPPQSSSPTTSPKKSATKAPRRYRGSGLLASLLEEELLQESDDPDEDDPALIQGRYFGPDNSTGFKCDGRGRRAAGSTGRSDRRQLLGSPPSHSSASSTPSDQQFLADHRSSSSSRDKDASSCSSNEEDAEEVRAAARCRRRKKRQLRAVQRRTETAAPAEGAGGLTDIMSKNILASVVKDLKAQNCTREQQAVKRLASYANAGTDDDYSTDGHRDLSESLWGSASYSDLMERMRYRQAQRSLSREPSICSNLSDILMSPGSAHMRFPFRRDDSVCSNLSDFAVSECSELSMDVSVKEEVNNTFRFLEEIEHDLDELKTSVLEMDEEVAMFNTKPDPYSHKITYSDYSLSSIKDENDSSSCAQNISKSSNDSGSNLPLAAPAVRFGVGWEEDESPEAGAPLPDVANSSGPRASDTDADCSLEWDSPQHGWTSTQPALPQGQIQKDEGLVSLEWDDGAVKQHPEPTAASRPLARDDSLHNFHDNTTLNLRKLEGFDDYKKSCRRSQLLPNHSSMELDLEIELSGPISLNSAADLSISSINSFYDLANNTSGAATLKQALGSNLDLYKTTPKADPLMTASTDSAIVTSMTSSAMTISSISSKDMTNSFTIAANMTGSTDSAIYSAPGSRSATASPLQAMFSETTLRSSGIGSCHERGSLDINEQENDQVAQDSQSRWSSQVAGRASGGGGGIDRSASVGSGDIAGEVGRRMCARWSSEESGFAEQDSDGAHGCLSPVTELREKESSDSNVSSPRHLSCSSTSNIYEISANNPNRGINSVLNDNENLNTLNTNLISNKNINSHLQSGTDKNVNYSVNRYPTETFDNDASHLSSQYNEDFNVLNDNLNGNGSFGMGNTSVDAPATNMRRFPSPASRQIFTIGEKIGLLEYSNREWQGDTEKAITIRKGYSAIQSEVGLSNLRCIRGDQYCGVRATTFQALSTGHPFPRCCTTLARLVAEVTSEGSWIKKWTFANRIHYENVLDGIVDCLDALDNVSDDLVGSTDRETKLVNMLNNTPQLDVQLCEAVKLHMLAAAMQLHGASNCGGNVPLFAMIMFARQSSQTPAELMMNHLNIVGDSGGLEQIEMFLLGHSMKATLQIVRPGSYGAEDYICYYPDTNIGVWPQLSLIAEDDRHYNVIVE